METVYIGSSFTYISLFYLRRTTGAYLNEDPAPSHLHKVYTGMETRHGYERTLSAQFPLIQILL